MLGSWGCFASAFCMCLSLVGLSYRGDSCIRLVDLLDLLSTDRFIHNEYSVIQSLLVWATM